MPDRSLLLRREAEKFHAAAHAFLMPYQRPCSQGIGSHGEANLHPDGFPREHVPDQNRGQPTFTKVEGASRQRIWNPGPQHSHIHRATHEKSRAVPPRGPVPRTPLGSSRHNFLKEESYLLTTGRSAIRAWLNDVVPESHF